MDWAGWAIFGLMATAALSESEERFRLVVEGAPDGVPWSVAIEAKVKAKEGAGQLKRYRSAVYHRREPARSAGSCSGSLAVPRRGWSPGSSPSWCARPPWQRCHLIRRRFPVPSGMASKASRRRAAVAREANEGTDSVVDGTAAARRAGRR